MQELETILVVDDDPNDVFILKRVLEKKGVLNPLQVVSSGEEAVAYLSGQGVYADRDRYPYPMLLLLDLKMKGMSGWDVLEWMKEQPNQPAEVAVLSGIEISQIKEVCEFGLTQFLFKPLNFSEFVHLIGMMDGIALREADNGCYLETLALKEA
jgi:CheY-like chemotaxis protein